MLTKLKYEIRSLKKMKHTRCLSLDNNQSFTRPILLTKLPLTFRLRIHQGIHGVHPIGKRDEYQLCAVIGEYGGQEAYESRRCKRIGN